MGNNDRIERFAHFLINRHDLNSERSALHLIRIDDGNDRNGAFYRTENGDLAEVGFSGQDNSFETQGVSLIEYPAIVLLGFAEE